MGGYAFQIPENLPESERFLPFHINQTWFLTTDGIDLLSRQGSTELPNLSQEEIESKSKANGLAKTLVCTQALWFIAQCSTRCTYLPLKKVIVNLMFP